MNIVLSGHEVCGIINDLATEFRRRGHTVTTIAKQDPFFNYRYDYDQYDFICSALSRRYGAPYLWSPLLKALWRTSSNWHGLLEKKLRAEAVKHADLYIRVWAHIPFDQEILKALVRNGTRIGTLLMGSDVRDWGVFKQEYGDGPSLDPTHRRLADKLTDLRIHERYADAIFSVPDQMGLALRPYHHLQVPIELSKFKFRVPGRVVPKIVHAPSVPELKGTDIIEDALQQLREEGLRFDFISLRNCNHETVAEVLADADFLVDELVGHGPGWLSFEAMASGCAVATRYLIDSPDCFRPPIVPIDRHNLIEQLRDLVSNRDRRAKLAHEGRLYVERNNTIERVAEMLLETIEAGRSGKPDYFPNFLRDHYVPANAAEARIINDANLIVQREEWYDRVRGHSHDGLFF